MPDGSYIIEVLLNAKDNMSAAFAKATGELEAYNKELEKQKASAAASRLEEEAFQKDIVKRGSALDKATKSQTAFRTELEKSRVTTDLATAAQQKQEASIDKLLTKYQRHFDVLSRGNVTQAQFERSTKALSVAQQDMVTKGLAPSDVALQRINTRLEDTTKRLESTRTSIRGYAGDLARTAHAPAPVTPGGATPGGPGGPGGITPIITSGFDDFSNSIQKAQGWLSKFGASWQLVLGAAVLQPAATLITGLAGTFLSLASAAGAAATAVGVTFLSGMAEAIPAMGLFAAAMGRMQNVMGVVQTLMQQQQLRFVAQYTTAAQTAMGINQVVIAQHNYSDALYAARQAVYNVQVAQHQYSDALFAQQQSVRQVTVSQHNYSDALYAQQAAVHNVDVAELALLTARQQATRQLQDLIFQEQQAKLAAQQSSLAISDAQKNLQQAIASGGDVAAAQLQLQQARVQHTQSVVQAQRAIADAAPGSIARQNVQESVVQAQRAVTDAQRAVVDSNFAVQQAAVGITQARRAVVDADYALVQARNGIVQAQRAVVDSQFQVAQAHAAIIQAQQAAVGYNLATAAQLAYLRSQMTKTELSLVGSITRVLNLFRGAHAYTAPLTDAILRPFKTLTDDIYNLFKNQQIFSALQTLANTIGQSLGKVIDTVFSPQSVSAFAQIIKDSAANMIPLTNVITSMFRVLQQIILAANPALHSFLIWLSDAASRFAAWASSVRGRNTLADWFNTAYHALEAFLSLGASIAKLFLAIAGKGGGADQGIKILTDLQSWINRTTNSINNQGRAWRTLQALWQTASVVLSALHTVFGAFVRAFLQLGTSSQGQQALKAMADLVAQIFVPALVQAVQLIGFLSSTLLKLLDANPWLKQIVETTLAWGIAVKLLLTPLAGIALALTKILELVKAVQALRFLGGGGLGGGTGAGAATTAAEGAAGGLLGLGGLGGLAGRILPAVGIGVGGVALGQIAGHAIGGTAGGLVGALGTGAGIGGGVGMMFGPEGALAGAAAGAIIQGTIKGFQDLFSGSGPDWSRMDQAAQQYGSKIGHSVTAGMAPAVQQQFTPAISSALAAANRALQYARHPQIRIDATTDPQQARAQAAAWTAAYQQEARKDMLAAGTIAGNAFIQNLQQVKHPTEYAILAAFNRQMAALPQVARNQAGLTMLQFAETLVQQGKLPQAQFSKLLSAMRAEMPSFRAYIDSMGLRTVQDFANSFKLTQAQQNLSTALQNMVREFQYQIPKITTDVVDPFGVKTYQAISFLRRIIPQLFGQARIDAENQLRQLIGNANKYYQTLVTQTQGHLANYVAQVKRGSRQGSAEAEVEFSHTIQILNGALAGGLINRQTYQRLVGTLRRTFNQLPKDTSKDAQGSGIDTSNIWVQAFNNTLGKTHSGVVHVLSSIPPFAHKAASDSGAATGNNWMDGFFKSLQNLKGGLAALLRGAIPGVSILSPTAPARLRHQFGGPILGTGRGDIIPAMLEPGEHVLTRREVAAAGGHGAIFAYRRSLGGGGQGGPFGYQAGGAAAAGAGIAPSAQTIFAALGLQFRGGQTTQGVTGLFGSTLANINLFVKRFENAWISLWKNINAYTSSGFSTMLATWTDSFKKLGDQISKFDSNTSSAIHSFWNSTNKFVQQQLGEFTQNFKNAYTKFANDTYNAFWYVNHAAGQELSSFGAKWSAPKLAAPPKFAEGGVAGQDGPSGFIGQPGERGVDLVPAILGRGEAVLNWAQQKVVDPALKAMYGYGLTDLFKRVQGEHAGPYHGKPRGANIPSFQAGGYVWPFGGPVNWERTDMGVDFSMSPGTPIAAVGNARIMGINQNWYQGQPYLWYQLLDGPDAGKYIYVAEQITPRVAPGQRVKAGQEIAIYANQGTGIEMGWGTTGWQTLQQATMPGAADKATAIGANFRSFLQGLGKGKIVIGPGGASALTWKNIAMQAVQGTGVLKEILQSAIKKVTDAANAFGQQQAGYTGGIPGGLSGPAEHQIYAALRSLGWNKIAIAGAIGNAVQESSLNPAAIQAGGGGMGLWQWTPGSKLTDFAAAQKKAWTDIGVQAALLTQSIGAAGVSAMNNAGSAGAAALWLMNNFERPGIPATANRIAAANQAFAQGFAEGGQVAGREGQAVPIIAHVGEWVVNQAQQGQIAGALGTSVGALRAALGFSGGPHEFQGGGIPRAITGSYFPFTGMPLINQLVGTIPGVPSTGLFPTVTPIDLPGYYQRILALFNRTQKRVSDAITTYLRNLQNQLGTGGIFDLAATAIQDYVNQQQTVVQLAAAGIQQVVKTVQDGVKRIRTASGRLKTVPNMVHVITESLRSMRPETAVQAAQADLDSTNQIIKRENDLQRQEVATLNSINVRIRAMQRQGITATDRGAYQRLIAARQQLIVDINTQDQNLAQAYSDQYTKAAALFQAQTAQALRGTATLTGGQIGEVLLGVYQNVRLIQASFNNLGAIMRRVGPQTGQAIAQMAQTIAQTLGDPRQLAAADQAVITSTQAVQRTIYDRYRAAAAKAQHDPRWQQVADDLLQQLESATAAVVQAQGQALTDAMSSQDTKTQIQQAGITMWQTILQAIQQTAQAFGPQGQFQMIQGQIGISQLSAQQIQQQIQAYQVLYNQAVQQGNIAAQNQLIQTIDNLNATLVQANAQTQQLITSYYQLSATIASSTTQAQQGFIQSATGIAQTLGQITGSLNLPQLIQIAQAARGGLVTQAGQAVQNITQMLAGGQQPFGTATGTAFGWLAQAIQAFQAGGMPGTNAQATGFATWLAQNAQQLAGFQAGLPQDQQQLFNNLIQALVDNTNNLVQNTLTLQQLNATTNQQAFSSTAWQMFRQAIFNGLGGLLPQYAMAVPTLQAGGMISRAGLLYGHQGEMVIPAQVSKELAAGNSYQTNHINITNPTEVADPNYLGNAIAWRLSHNPSVR